METHSNQVQENITVHMVISSIEETTRTGSNGIENWGQIQINWMVGVLSEDVAFTEIRKKEEKEREEGQGKWHSSI